MNCRNESPQMEVIMFSPAIRNILCALAAATLAVLSRATAETSQVAFISSDGSPTQPGLPEPSIFRGVAQAMVVAPDADLPLRLITPDERLYTLSGNGNWPRTSSKVAAAAYLG